MRLFRPRPPACLLYDFFDRPDAIIDTRGGDEQYRVYAFGCLLSAAHSGAMV